MPANQVVGLRNGTFTASSASAARMLLRHMVLAQCDYEQGVPGVTSTTVPPLGTPSIARCPQPSTPQVSPPPTTSTTVAHKSSGAANAARLRRLLRPRPRPRTLRRRRPRRGELADGDTNPMVRSCDDPLVLWIAGPTGQHPRPEGEPVSERSRNPITVENEYAKPRGTIVSSDGVILATSVPTPNNSLL